MLKRLIVLFLFVGIISGGIWYLLINNPAEKIDDLQAKINKLVQSDNPDDWHTVTTKNERLDYDIQKFKDRLSIARKTSDLILEINPNSGDDLMARALLEEMAGNFSGSLEWYDRGSALDNPPAGIELRRARTLRKTGHFNAAKGALTSVVDIYPFQSNVELGQLYLDLFQPVEALRSFNQARNYANDDNEIRQVVEGRSRALEFMISLNQNRVARSADNGQEERQIRDSMMKKLKKDYQVSLSNAIKLWRQVDPRTKEAFVAVQYKIFELLTKTDNPDSLEIARKSLTEATLADNDGRDFPIYMLLGNVNLYLAYHSGDSEAIRDQYIERVKVNFSKVFAYNFGEESSRYQHIADWNFHKNISREDFETILLLKVCDHLLDSPQYWRILQETGENEGRDSLEIKKRIEVALSSGEINDLIKRDIKIVQALAILKSGNQEAFQKKYDQLFLSETKESKIQLALKIAGKIVQNVPDEPELLVQIIDKSVLDPIQHLEQMGDSSLFLIQSIINLLNRAESQYNAPNQSMVDSRSEMKVTMNQGQSNFSECSEYLRKKIVKVIHEISNSTNEPNEYLVASKFVSSLVGIDEAITVLNGGIEQFPDDHSLKYALGFAQVVKANNSEENNQWESYRKAIKAFLPLIISRPYTTDSYTQLFLIAGHFKNNSISDLGLAESIVEIFPKCSPEESDYLSEVLGAFLKREFEVVINLASTAKEMEGVRPFLNLIIGTSYLQQASYYHRKSLSETPGLSANTELSDYAEKASDLFTEGREIFQQGLALDQNYFPIQTEIIKMELDEIKEGEPVSENLQNDIKNLVEQYSSNPLISYLFGRASALERIYALTQSVRKEEILSILREERSLFRKSIRENTTFVDAYLALAESYVIPWRMKNGSLQEHYETASRIFSIPDFKVAITILQSAPQSPRIIERIAHYLTAENKIEEALLVYKKLLNAEPVEANLKKVIQAYLSIEQFDNARIWLKSLNESVPLQQSFKVTYHTLLALIDSQQANIPETSHYDRKKLEDNQIKQYRQALASADQLGIPLSLGAANNLAYLLTERGEIKESLKIIEPFAEVMRDKSSLISLEFRQAVEETLAWTYYKAADLEKSNEIYKRLCESQTKSEFHLHYAHVLYDLQDFETASQQINMVTNSLNDTDKDARHLDKQIKKLQKQIEVSIHQ